MLSEWTRTWCPLRSGKKVWRTRHTACISRQLMCWMQPVLDASVETTFLLQTISKGTACSTHWWHFQGPRAATQSRFTLIRRRPWCQVYDGTLGFSQRWRGHIRSRPSCSTGDAEAMRPSIFWNVLIGERLLSWRRPRDAVWPEHALVWPQPSIRMSRKLFPGTISIGWGTVRSWQIWPWFPGILSGWEGGICAIAIPPLTGPEWTSRRVENADSHLP